MVKVAKPPKPLKRNPVKKIANGVEKKDKQNPVKSTDAALKKTLVKKDVKSNVQKAVPLKAKDSKDVKSNVQKKVQLKAEDSKDVKPKVQKQVQLKATESKDIKPNVQKKVQSKAKESKDIKPIVQKTVQLKANDSKDVKPNVPKKVQLKAKKVDAKEKLKEIKPKNTNIDKNSKIGVKRLQKSGPKKIGAKKPINGSKKEVKAKKGPAVTNLKSTNFDEEQFNKIVTTDNIEKICEALKKLVEDEVAQKKTSIFSDYKYVLNVSSYKIPNCPKRMVKLDLKHSLVDPNEDDIALIVPDLQRGAKVDYEPTIQHYEDLLREKGISGIKIIPFNQLRKEYTTFEAKRKLANTYDYFLCDGRISGHCVGFCGKNFQKVRTTLHSVHLEDPDKYKTNIEKALKRTGYKQLHKGDMITIPVGNDRFTIKQLAENIKAVIDHLKEKFPGGYPNIRNMYIKIDIKGTSALPLYVNLAGPPADTPNVVGPREKRMLKLKKQANEVLSKFSLSKTGDFVKLNKTQVERKRQINEARSVLLSTENTSEVTAPPTKKLKKDVGLKSAQDVESEDEDVEDQNDVDSEEDISENSEED
ncbi:hypothetical protein DOY81_005651 [Sarcophaga bullata]|nr:hypothetical protein DOY81_005651 [Sarcophaga bullata]